MRGSSTKIAKKDQAQFFEFFVLFCGEKNEILVFNSKSHIRNDPLFKTPANLDPLLDGSRERVADPPSHMVARTVVHRGGERPFHSGRFSVSRFLHFLFEVTGSSQYSVMIMTCMRRNDAVKKGGLMGIPSRTSRSDSPGRRRWAGFTLIELLVVIAIIAVLASLLVPAVQKGIRAAYRVDDTSNIRSATQAMMNYSFDHDDEIVAWDWNARFQGYIYQVIPYLGGPESPTWSEALTTLQKFRSKAVVDRSLLYVSGAPGWSLPRYATATTRVDKRNPNYMRLSEIKNPNRQIYAALGFGVFDETSGQDPAFTLPDSRPAGARDLHIYFPYDGKGPAGFFDGHVEVIEPVIPLDMLTNEALP